MSLSTYIRKHYKILVTVVVTVIAVLCRNYFSNSGLEVYENKSIQIFSQEQLMKYNGIDDKIIYLAVTGTIFDVTQKPQHYGKGSAYHYFVGKDGSRALVTGIFTDESETKDHILDLSCNELHTILDWRKTFKEKYPTVGFLIGRYYDKYGRETDYMRVLKKRLQKCKEEKERLRKESLIYPPCNISWNEDEGTRVWCTISSGGVIRNWVGVPRQLYAPGEDKPRCVCVQPDQSNFSLLKPYDGCPIASEECLIQETK